MDARKRFFAALSLFVVWVAALATLATVTGRRPVVKATATAPAAR